MPAWVSQRRNSRISLFTLALIVTAWPALAQSCNSNDPGAPCFAGVKDILGGVRNLLADDDLLFQANVYSSDTSGFSAQNAFFLTTDSTVSPVSGKSRSGQKVSSNSIANSARMFATNQATGVTAFASFTTQGNGSVRTFFTNGDGSPSEVDLFQNTKLLPGCTQKLYSVAADFTGSGYEDVVVGSFFPGSCFNFQTVGMTYQVVTAQDPSNPAAGFKTGPKSTPYPTQSTLFAVAAGTFTDPTADIPNPLPQIAQLTTRRGSESGKGLEIAFFGVDPSTLEISDLSKSIHLTLPASDSGSIVSALAISAGRFSGASHDQLAVAYATLGGTAKIITVDFDSEGNPVQQTIHDTGIAFTAKTYPSGYPGSLFLHKAKFNFFGSADQAGLSVEPGQNSASLEVLSFDADLNTSEGPRFTPPGPCHYAMAVGRFDRMQGQPAMPDPNLQMADVVTSCLSTAQIGINIYDVDPMSFAVTTHSSYTTPFSFLSGAPYYSQGLSTDNSLQASLAPADLQGRSLVLGNPEKATVTNHIQPDTVLGVPPMHVDWVTPAASSAPGVLNVSVYPSSFYTGYKFASTDKSSASTSQTTSYTVATKTTIGESVSYGIPGDNVSVQSQQAIGQTHQNTVAKKYNTYQGTQTSISTATVFDDELAATENQMNIYSYRVIGQCTPLAGALGQEGCKPGYAPYYVQFSGPDNIEYLPFAAGRNVEWYQPVQEPGNLFSYPGSVAQLEANLPASTPFQPLTPTDNLLDVQGNGAVGITWTKGQGTSLTSGSVSNHSFDASVSVSSHGGIGFFSGGASTGFNYNDSSSLKTLNQSSTSVDSSEGVVVHRGLQSPGSGEVYDYAMQAVIFGQSAPVGTIQNDIVNTAQVPSNGFIDVGWIADPLSTGGIQAGNFWRQAYGGFPDVALNHPQRWMQKVGADIHGEEVMFQCPAGYTSSYTSPACAFQTPAVTPNPQNVADLGFYQIKGLFLTPGGTTAGPQITNVKQGDALTLRVRVYNYSVQNTASLPAGTRLRVQFYAQPWDSIHGQFASIPANTDQAFANATFIGEGTDAAGNALGPVPGFCGGITGADDPCLGNGASTKNWVFAQTTWNTSAITPGSYWKFWVVTWLESNGSMVSELAGHGLPASTLKNCLGKRGTPCFLNIGDVAVADSQNIETYSNNFGYYNQIFWVSPPTEPGDSPSGRLALTGVKAPVRSLIRDEPARIEAHHRAVGNRVDNILALYYDGDPDKGGVQYDVEQIAGIAANQAYVDPGNYVPASCGRHELFVRSIPTDGSSPTATASTTVKVTIDALGSIHETRSYLDGLKIGRRLKDELADTLEAAHRAFKEGDTDQGRRKIEEFLDRVRCNADKIPEHAVHALTNQEKDLLDCTR